METNINLNLEQQPRSVCLSKLTHFEIGGPCHNFYQPQSLCELVPLWKKIQDDRLSYFVLGCGSNVLAADEPIQKIIVSLKRMNKISISGSTLKAEAGALTNKMAKKCAKNSLSGLEFIYGLPATIGGALYMNARCFGGEICENLEEAEILTPKGTIQVYRCDTKDFSFKVSPFQKMDGCLILSATFKLEGGVKTRDEIERLMMEKFLLRVEKGHFKAPSGGSYFKNPSEGPPAGVLIDRVGLKGVKLGGAQIAPWHGNFLINSNGKATAENVRRLAEIVKEKVKLELNVELEEEVIYLN